MIPDFPPAGSNLTPAMSWSYGGSLAPGTIVDEHFEIISAVGRGGMSVVYRAKDRRLDRVVALKMLNGNLVKDDGALKRFQREAVAVGTLSHPNIVSVFGFGQWRSQPYVVMELLEGQSLSEFVDTEKPSNAQLVKLFLQILDGLAYAHARGIIHRDLKPRNIMLTNSNTTVKIVDFGIAKVLPESGKEIQKLTQTGELFGTISYMSPEQCMGNPLDARSDIYSMGCLMYECLSGHPPFEGSSGYAVMAKHLDLQITEPPCDDPVLSNVVLSTLEKDPQRRPESAAELAGALRKPEAWKMQKAIPKPKITVKKLPVAIAAGGIIAVAGVSAICLHPQWIGITAPVELKESTVRTSPGAVMGKVHDLMFDHKYDKAAEELLRNRRVFIQEDVPTQVSYYSTLSQLYLDQGFFSQAENNAVSAIDMGAPMVRSRRWFSFDYALAMSARVQCLIQRGRVQEGAANGRMLVDYLRKCGTEEARYDLRGNLRGIGDQLASRGDQPAARIFFDAAKQIEKEHAQ